MPSSLVVSIQDCKQKIKSSNPCISQVKQASLVNIDKDTKRRMNIYIFDIFINHCIMLENTKEDNMYVTYFNLVEIGPLNLPDPSNLEAIKYAIRNISSTSVTSNWWTEFSSWEDFHGLLRTGTKLSVHSVVSEINKTLQSFENAESYMESIDDNGNITIHLDESFPTLFQGFKITAKRKRIRNLREIAAFNVAKYISSENYVKKLKIPSSLYKLITVFLDTYSDDYKTA